MPDSDDANASEIFRAAQCERRIAAAFPARVQSGYANARTDHCRQRARGTRASGRCAILLQEDRKLLLAERAPQLDAVVYHRQLGSQWQRVKRIEAIACAI